MLSVDGSLMEGGGQIVRSAVALSAISERPVEITNIRANRERPGLAAQHVAAVRAVAEACGATCTGLSVGSRKIIFFPGAPRKGDSRIEVGTAGSVSLVIQAWVPVALLSGGTLTVTGGTEVEKSPTIDYVDRVYAAVLRRHGARIAIGIERRGYYPAGGGCVTVKVDRAEISPLHPDAEKSACGICSCSSNLPDHVAERQAKSAAAVLPVRIRESCTIHLDRRKGPGTGSSCTVWQGAKGGCALGKRGLPAERVGESAGLAALAEFEAPGAVDIHLSDQLLLPLAIYGGSYATHSCSLHAKTQCWLLRQFGYPIRYRENGIAEFSA
jgi:RNA 3'-terminal phosphate cyclase (ATP)